MTERHIEAHNPELSLDLGSGDLVNSSFFPDVDKTVFLDGAAFEGVNVVSDLEKPIPLSSAQFDFVLLSNLLEHLANPELVLQETHRLLKEGGSALILVPFAIKLHQEPFDFHRYTRHALFRLCKDAGFSNLEIAPLGSLHNILGTLIAVAQVNSAGLARHGWGLMHLLWRVMDRLFPMGGPIELWPQGYSVVIYK